MSGTIRFIFSDFPKESITLIREGKRKIIIPEKRIFGIPNWKDIPLFFWVYDRRIKPAMAVAQKVIIVNFHSLNGMEDIPEEYRGVIIYLSCIIVEELVHCCTRSLKNHKKWVDFIINLHKELGWIEDE